MDLVSTAARGAAVAGGQALRAATGALAAARPAAKPLHPEGSVVTGVLQRFGSAPRTGVAWLDEPGSDDVLARQSRAVGLPPPAPDVFGLALRVRVQADRYADVLLATTGLGRLTRFTLTPARTPYTRPMTTLLPYRTVAGPVVLAGGPHDDAKVELPCAVCAGPWRPFGWLGLDADHPEAEAHAPISFDPLLNTLPGLDNYPWVRRLREPSYLTARRSRS